MNFAADLISYYLRYVGKNESPSQYHTWSLLACVSAALSRRVWARNGHFKVHPNLYVMLLGEPAVRKSTAINIARDILRDSGFNGFAASQAGKDQFYCDLEDNGLASIDSISQQFICADEFNSFIGENNKPFITALTELFDCKDEFRAKLRKANTVILLPSVQILGGNTHANFATAFPPAVLHNGFLSRFLLVYGQRKAERVTWLKEPNANEKEKLRLNFERIANDLHGEMGYTPEALEAIDEIYQTWEELDDLRFTHYGQRRQTHLLKLCIVCAACALKLIIEYTDVLLANTLLHSIEEEFPRALGEFGKSKTNEEASIVMNVLYTAGRAVHSAELYKAVATSLDKVSAFEDLMASLNRAGKVKQEADGFLPVYKHRKLPAHVDFSLLGLAVPKSEVPLSPVFTQEVTI